MLSRISDIFSDFFLEEDVRSYYSLGKEVGRGNFGVVRLATNLKDGKVSCVKIIDKQAKNVNTSMLKAETAIISKVNHPNVVRLERIFETRNHLYLIQDYLEGGELYGRLQSCPEGLPESEVSYIITQVLFGLQYLHTLGIVHRDLKPENIMIDKKATPNPNSPYSYLIKIMDFGLSTMMDSSRKAEGLCGTPLYFAPEMLSEDTYGCKVDIWATGVIVYTLLSGYYPFYSESSLQELFELIRNGVYTMEVFPSQVSGHGLEFVRYLLDVNPDTRPAAEEALSHPWLSQRVVTASENLNCSYKNLKPLPKNLFCHPARAQQGRIRRVPFLADSFAPLTKEYVWNHERDLPALLKFTEAHTYSMGDTIVDKADRQNVLYYIESGNVKAFYTRGDGFVYEKVYYPEEMFNTGALFMEGVNRITRQLEFKAVTDTVIYPIERKLVLSIQKSNPLLAARTWWWVAHFVCLRTAEDLRKWVFRPSRIDYDMSGHCSFKKLKKHKGKFEIANGILRLWSNSFFHPITVNIPLAKIEATKKKLLDCSLQISHNKTKVTIFLDSIDTVNKLEAALLKGGKVPNLDHVVCPTTQVVPIPPEYIQYIGTSTNFKVYNANEVVLKQFEEVKGLYIIWKGSCTLRVNDPTDDKVRELILPSGYVTGFTSFFSQKTNVVGELVAREDDTEIFLFTREPLLAKVESDHNFGAELFRFLGESLTVFLHRFIESD